MSFISNIFGKEPVSFAEAVVGLAEALRMAVILDWINFYIKNLKLCEARSRFINFNILVVSILFESAPTKDLLCLQ